MKPITVSSWIKGCEIRQQAFNRTLHQLRSQGLLVDEMEVLRVALAPEGPVLIAQTKSFGTIARSL